MSGLDQEEFLKIEKLLKNVVNASNRTTRAVRAFVGFLLIQVAFGTIAGVLYFFSQIGDESRDWLVVFAAVLYLLGFVLANIFAWGEFSDSGVENPSFKSYSSGSASYSSASSARSSNSKLTKCKVCNSALDPDKRCSIEPSHKQY